MENMMMRFASLEDPCEVSHMPGWEESWGPGN